MWIVNLILSCVILKLSLGDEEVFVNIAQGTLRGLNTTTVYHKKPICSFKGIPYAKPNIGLNKFRTPEPAEGWTGVRDATQYGSFCVQLVGIFSQVLGDDDCLFLNVYTPDLNRRAKRAVMVFIHGGGYNGGESSDYLYGPDFLIERDIVLVTINYRLGASGFLNTGDANAPGNAGMKDQVLAMRWVQKNIRNFSGCPSRVTIFGESAGSVSVQCHLISPMSRGLFSGAIMQSGPACSPGFSYTPLEDAMYLANKLGIKAESTADLVQQLAQIPTTRLVAATLTYPLSETLYGKLYMKPGLETDFGQEMFLPGSPWDLIKSGRIADVPMIIGVVRDEGRTYVPSVLTTLKTNVPDFKKFIPSDLNITDPEQREKIANILEEFYFHGEAISNETEEELTKLITDVGFWHGVALSNKIIDSRISSPVYQYLFNFFSPQGFYKNMINITAGIDHADDLGYLFYSTFYKNIPKPGTREEQKLNEMVEMWTDFAKERNPSATMKYAKVEWEPLNCEDNYLDIGNDLVMKKSLWKDRVDLWVDIAKDILGDYIELFYN